MCVDILPFFTRRSKTFNWKYLMAEIAVVRFSLKLVWGLVANRAIASLEHGDVADEKLRQLLLSEFRKIHEQLNALRRKELVAATAFMENGYELLQEDTKEALKEFNKARDAAQMAFGVVSDDHDKVLATKIMVASALHEFADKPGTAVSLCVKYVSRLNSLPEVASACAVTLGFKFGSKLRMMTGSANRQELLKSVSEINRCVWQFVCEHDEDGKCRDSPWPKIHCGEHRINPTTNLVLFRQCFEVMTLPDNFGTAVAMVEAQGKLFFAQSQNSAEAQDKLLQHSLKVFDLETKKVSDLVGHTGMVLSLIASDNYVLSGSFDKNVLVWDSKTLKCLRILTGHEGSVRALAANAKYVFSGSTDTSIRVWDKVTFELCQTLETHTMPITAMAANNRYIFSVAVNEGIKIWDLRTWSCLHAVKIAHISNVTAVLFLHNLALVHSDYNISVFNLGNLKQVGTFEDAGKISEIVGTQICSGAGSTLKGWDVTNFKCTSTKSFKDEQETVDINCICYSKESGYLYVASTNTGTRGKRNVILRL